MSAWKSPTTSRRQLIDAVMDGYVSWREASVAATTAYEKWARAGGGERAPAFDTYRAALDREERAAAEYQRLVEQVPVP